jgi:hypothetical protein
MTARGLRAIAVVTLAALSVATLARAQTSSSAAPASGSAQGSGDLEVLRERAAAFWAARVSGADPMAEWNLLEPRGRGRLAPSAYAYQRGPVKYIAYQVEEASASGYFGTVKVRLLVQPMMAGSPAGQRLAPAAVVLPDRWVRIQGVWYRSLEQGSVTPPAANP